MSNEFQIGKELGELRARLEHLEAEVRSKKCDCSGSGKGGMALMKVHPDDENRPGTEMVELEKIEGEAAKALLSCGGSGTTSCIGGICNICCNGSWYRIKKSNGQYLYCPVPAATYQANCNGQAYWVGGCT